MYAFIFRCLLGLTLALSGLLPAIAMPGRTRPPSAVVADFNTRLQPGVYHGWVMRPSSAEGGYIVEVTPLQKPRPNAGNYVQLARVLPEYDGASWNDVLRVQLPEGSAALTVNVRVYETSRLPVLTEFDTVLEPGVWHGFSLGQAAENRAYVGEVTPLEAGEDGDFISKIHFQPEYPGEWIDVLRLQIPETQHSLKVHVRVFTTANLPVAADFDTILEPGAWQGYFVQPSKVKAGTVVEVTPLDEIDGAAELALVQPEFDGKTWNDILRLITWEDRPPLRVNVRVYTITPYW